MTGRSPRRQRADEVLAGYVSGPEAATEATALAMAKISSARSLLLVEGISDQIAVETLARCGGWDLDNAATVVVPIGGAQAIVRYLPEFVEAGFQVAGLCDRAEEPIYRQAVTSAGLGAPTTRAELADLGFSVCVEDLEDELIRACGVGLVVERLAAEGDLGSFETMQKQPAWRGRPVEAQLRRFLGAGARRKSRYARLLVEALGPDRAPAPLAAVLDHSL